VLALAWPVGLAVCATWLVAAAASRMSSLAALVAAAASTVWMVLLGQGQALLLGVVLTLLIFWRHRANISRLRAGTEPKIGRK
jgi:acyl phosphate:glycerol-3-phosphate acyltransferase